MRRWINQLNTIADPAVGKKKIAYTKGHAEEKSKKPPAAASWNQMAGTAAPQNGPMIDAM
ncbi:hypothetical protein [Ralstonia sp. UBA689]|uniref:hypothetical protein n=1 Tax=Ralstonia sp. UBA689 TaxID=1947373 RepID=UPI0025E21600|nr:hypothetical protein [Ralstonia sp. UBA689]